MVIKKIGFVKRFILEEDICWLMFGVEWFWFCVIIYYLMIFNVGYFGYNF